MRMRKEEEKEKGRLYLLQDVIGAIEEIARESGPDQVFDSHCDHQQEQRHPEVSAA